MVHEVLEGVAGCGTHQHDADFLRFGIGDNAALSERIAGALIHQVVVNLHHIQFAGGDELLHSTGRTIRREPDEANLPFLFQFQIRR